MQQKHVKEFLFFQANSDVAFTKILVSPLTRILCNQILSICNFNQSLMHVSPEIGERRSLPPKDDVALTRSWSHSRSASSASCETPGPRVTVSSPPPTTPSLAHYDIRGGWLETGSGGRYELRACLLVERIRDLVKSTSHPSTGLYVFSK